MSDVPLHRRRFLLGAAAVGAGVVAGLSGAVAAGARSGSRTSELAVGAAGSSTALALTRSVGSFEVVALRDASGPFFLPRSTAFPNASVADWDRAMEIDPGAFGPGDTWNLDFHCFAIRRPGGRVTLVDAGVGPDGSPASAWAPVPGHLPEVLAAASIDVNDVDTVVLTHLHEDHLGWSVDPDGRPMFPNARYVVQQQEVAALVSVGDQALLQYVIEPLRHTGQLQEVEGRVRLVDAGSSTEGGPASGLGGAITLIPTPGHTPGHQSVLVAGDLGRIMITGDVLVHAVQLANPDVAYRYERDKELARRSRHALLGQARAADALLATAHLTRPFVPAR
ncbi:MAG TPA: MBL fold metallo-hydrolase [Micromonosporaceae bacterium]|nr:MBL fold metallo-hydrolase [Micromonosporaceae bacterium]